MAIKNSLGQIIGVIQLINKFDGLVSFLSAHNKFCTAASERVCRSCSTFHFRITSLISTLLHFSYRLQAFTKNDENFVEAFAIFCGMGISNTHMYEKAIQAMAKQSVTLEVLSYHASASIDDAHRLRVCIINHDIEITYRI